MASTYVNDLRLNEMATGDGSGTWGTTTNTNLELIGEALGYGTEGITTNADTHTSTVADGATDPVRAMFVKYTGTLDSACTITIAPNTVNRMQFIENGTSGSQNIIISQGSGANITIPPGDVKAVYLDGAGSGAAVVDAFASLNVVDLKVQDDLTVTDDLTVGGDIDVDGTSNLDIVDIDGATQADGTITVGVDDTGYDVKFFGATSGSYLLWNESIDDLTLAGAAGLVVQGNADFSGITNLDVTDIDGAVNMATTLLVTGEATLASHLNMGDGDVIKLGTGADLQIYHDGTNALLTNTTGDFYIQDSNGTVHIQGKSGEESITAAADGAVTLYHNNAAKLATASGGVAITGNATFADDGKAIFGAGSDLQIFHDGSDSYVKDAGTGRLVVETDGTDVSLKAGSDNMLVATKDGAVTLYHNNAAKLASTATGIDVTGIAVSDGMSTNTSGTSNFVAGVNAGNSIASGGNYNVCVGDEAGTAINTGDNNVAVGYAALDANSTGSQNVALGFAALSTNTTASNNVGVGYAALNANTTGTQNIAVGFSALIANTTANSNIAIGTNALAANTTGASNTAVGENALAANTEASNNVAVGAVALDADTLGTHSTALGKGALSAQNFTSATSSENTAVGYIAGTAVTTGVQNTLIGSGAGDSLTDADSNIAVGYAALATDTLGSRATALGRFALFSQNFTSATNSENVGVGYYAGKDITTGVQNTLIGTNAADALTDADFNVAVGYAALATDTLGSRSTAIGRFALTTQNFTSATDTHNSAVGYYAGKELTTGTNNSFFGALAGANVTDGVENTLIGALCVDNLTTGSLNTAIGYNLSPSAVDVDSEIVIGSSITGAGTNTVRIGTGGGTATLGLDGSDTSWAAASDSRLKKDVTDSTAGLEFINDLRPITFKWNAKNEVAEDLPQHDADSSDPIFGEGKAHHGFIAQEVKAVIDDHSDVLDGNNIWHEDPDGTQQLSQGNLVPMLVKAVQELSAKIAELESKPRCKCNGE